VSVAGSHGRRTFSETTVHVVYENAENFDQHVELSDGTVTDSSGNAAVQIFGTSHVRIFAEEQDGYGVDSTTYYSKLIELDAAHLPPSLSLVLNSTKLPTAPTSPLP
jgi:hypothetical protein